MAGTLILSLFLSWVQVSSDTYIVKSSAGEERAKHVLEELEGFHQLIGTFIFQSAQLPELPIEVLLIGDDETMKALAPEYNGRKLGIAGYYQRGYDRDYIVLSGRVFTETLTSIVYHELTHYFLSRAFIADRPAWLNEGLAEYFATAEFRDERVLLGGLSAERMQSLRSNPLLPLSEFFSVDSNSPYYNEELKASVFYAQAWAFVHYLLEGPHAGRFRQYLDALKDGEASLTDFLKVSERELQLTFENYVRIMLPLSARTSVHVPEDSYEMRSEPISDSEVQVTIAEIFLANGQREEARRRLEAADPSPRASYYRGVLARTAADPAARDFFVDALPDAHLGPRAAAQLVDLGEGHIPAVRTLLEQAAASGTHNPAVHEALRRIKEEERMRREEAARIAQQRELPPIHFPAAPAAPAEPETQPVQYAEGGNLRFKYALLSAAAEQPRVQTFVEPYYPEELLLQKLAGEVVLDVQVTENGQVAGMWLVSSTPEIFANLATTAIRLWNFEPVSAKIRIVLEFTPTIER